MLELQLAGHQVAVELEAGLRGGADGGDALVQLVQPLQLVELLGEELLGVPRPRHGLLAHGVEHAGHVHLRLAAAQAPQLRVHAWSIFVRRQGTAN